MSKHLYPNDGGVQKRTELLLRAIGPAARNPVEGALLPWLDERWTREEQGTPFSRGIRRMRVDRPDLADMIEKNETEGHSCQNTRRNGSRAASLAFGAQDA